MPFLRISRDRRGYEYYCLVHTLPTRRGKPQQRTLYWFRTPPNLKVGRGPLDDDVRRALEAKHPDVTFDWDALLNTPMPPPSVEYWRERRRAEKVLRQQRATDDTAEVSEHDDERPPESSEAVATDEESAVTDHQPSLDVEMPASLENESESDGVLSVETAAEVSQSSADSASGGNRRRRRRRGRRGRPPLQSTRASAVAPGEQANEPDSSSSSGDIQDDVQTGDDSGENR